MSLARLTQIQVQTIQLSNTMAEAAQLMCRHSVGALVITDATAVTPVGVITDRDLVWMISEGLDPKEAIVGQFIRSSLHTIPVTAGLGEAVAKMREHGVRRLPIVDQEGRLLGIVSLDDIVVLLGKELADAAAAIQTEMGYEHRVGSGREGKK